LRFLADVIICDSVQAGIVIPRSRQRVCICRDYGVIRCNGRLLWRTCCFSTS